jgi:Ca-activated chloride channel family protein
MRDWTLTAGLCTLAGLALYLSPNLQAATPGAPATPAAPAVPVTPMAAPVADAAGATLTVDLDRATVANGRVETRYLTVDLTMPAVSHSERKPLDLAVVIDNSGSMSGEKIANARAAAHHLVDALSPEDRFSLVVFDSRANVLVSPTLAADRAPLHQAIDRIRDAGGTNLYAGLDVGLRELGNDGRIPRLILLSDGQTNEGITDPGEIARRASNAFERGVGISTIGLGIDFNEDLLFSIAKSGGGSYDFVADPTQLASVFADELDHSTSLAGRQAVVYLDLGPDVEAVEVFGWAAVPTERGWRVSLGDLPSSATRRLVAEVKVRATRTAPLQVASARATWLDADGQPRDASATETVEVSTSLAQADASVIQEVERAAAYVVGNALSMRSAAAYAAGNAAEATGLVRASRAQFQRAADLGSAKAAARMEDVEEQEAEQLRDAPSSEAGRRNIKEKKALSALGYVDAE